MNDTPLTPGSFPESDETRPPEEITPTPHTESQSENSTLSEEAPLPSIEDPVHGDPSEATGAAYTPEAPKAPEMPYTPECPRASVNAPRIATTKWQEYDKDIYRMMLFLYRRNTLL